MNYLLSSEGKAKYSIVFDDGNPSILSSLDLGMYIPPTTVKHPLRYKTVRNSCLTLSELLESDVIATVAGGILVSAQVKALIEAHFPYDVQFFSTEIQIRGQWVDSHFAMNIYNEVECYDLESSIYEKSPVDGSYEFDKIVLIETPLEEYGVEYNIVRSVYDHRIVVSDKFRDLMRGSNVNSLVYNSMFEMEW